MKKRIRGYLLLLLFLVAVTLLAWFRGGFGITLDFGDDALTVTGPQKFSFTVDYDQIAALELVELTDAGEVLSGGDNRSCSWGERRNDAWGQYTLCAAEKADTAILITTRQGERLVFSYENDDTMASLYQMFSDMLAERAQTGAAA